MTRVSYFVLSFLLVPILIWNSKCLDHQRTEEIQTNSKPFAQEEENRESSHFAARGTISYKGCYKDQVMRRDLEITAWKENQETTVRDCIRRCHDYGYKYAGLQVSLAGLLFPQGYISYTMDRHLFFL